MKKKVASLKLKSALLKNQDGAPKGDSMVKALVTSTTSLKKAGDLLLKAVQSLPENDASLAAAADALITAHSSLITALQLLADAGNLSVHSGKLPPAAERLRALKYTLN